MISSAILTGALGLFGAAMQTSPNAADHPVTGALHAASAASSYEYCDSAPADAALEALLAERLDPEAVGVTEDQLAAALLVRAGFEIAAAQPNARSCRRVFRNGERTFERRLARATRSMRAQAASDRSDDPQIAEVQEAIANLRLADQAGRLAYVALQTRDRAGSDFWAQRLATANAVTTDARSTELMRRLLDQYDWIDAHRFGSRVARHAWILVQHADDHPEFQALALSRMEAYLDNGGVRARDYAYLYDRVAVNTGALQRYGTQPADRCNDDGTLDLKPVEDIDQLDARRAGMGLGPYQADLDAMAANRCG